MIAIKKEVVKLVVRCASDELKDDIIFHIQKSINSLENFKKLHRGLLQEELPVKDCPECGMSFTTNVCPTCGKDGLQKFSKITRNGITTYKKIIRKKPMSKEGYEGFHEMVDDAIINYTNLNLEINDIPDCKGEFSPLFGTIKCLPREIKQDLVPFLRRKVKSYSEMGNEELAKEAGKLAEVFQNKVCNCTTQGNPSGPWLYRRGNVKKDLVIAGNIQQLP